MAKRRTETWLALIVVAVGLLLATMLGLYGYVSLTSTPLHPDALKVPSVTARAPSSRWAPAAEQAATIVGAELVAQNLPGMSVAVGVGGEIVWAQGFGWADLENQVKVTPDTRFRIGTASKVFTSAAVGVLLDQGRLSLDEKIQTYVPAFPDKQWPVTLRQVMGHLAGVRNDAGDEEQLSAHCERTADGLQRFAERPLLFEPGTNYRYSSYGWILVSAAVEAAANQPFFRFLRSEVFEPLGMAHTKADSSAEPVSNLANFYFPRFAANPRYGPQSPQQVDYSCFAGAAAFLSTPSDLARFAMAINGGRLLQPATVHLLQASQRLPSGQETGYGLGWDLETVSMLGRPTVVTGYDGELMGGMVASLMTFRDHDVVVAVTANIAFADTASLALNVAEVFAEQARSPARK